MPRNQRYSFADMPNWILKKIKNYNTWLKYEQSGDERTSTSILTKLKRKREDRRGRLTLPLTQPVHHFRERQKDQDDEDFFLPSGSLFFDKESGEFKIEDRQKAAGEKLSGKVLHTMKKKGRCDSKSR